MKKILLSAILLTLCQASFAKDVKVEALSDFTTANPTKTWQVKILDNFTTKDGFEVKSGAIIQGNIENVKDPARLKRNASFVFIPTQYNDINGQTYSIQKDFTGKYSFKSDMSTGKMIKKGAITAGNHLINGAFGPGIALIEGAVKNEKGNRAKSAVVSAYESTPLSYANKGKNIEVKKGQQFIMSFKELKTQENDEPNYTYTLE